MEPYPVQACEDFNNGTAASKMLLKAIYLVVTILQIVSCVYINDKGEEFKIDSKELVIINGTRYYFMHILTATLYNAQLICKDDGLSLISLENQYESDAVYAYLQQENMDLVFWTSGVLVGDKWMWSSTGDFLSYNNWAIGQPNGDPYPFQSCIYYARGKLWDNPCADYTANFICEQPPKC